MPELKRELPAGKRFYFASDFHLGVPDAATSLQREKKIIQWLDTVAADAAIIFLPGDLFDFWFEYRKAIPKGFTRFLGKLAELTDRGIDIHLFTGNHDLWMFGYLQQEIGVTVHHDPVTLVTGHHRILIGHGDGLGPGDKSYNLLKKIFTSPIAQFLFNWLHPDIGIALAQRWSRHSRISNMKAEEKFKGEEREFLLAWCRETEKREHHDYYIFGHRHLPLDLSVGEGSRYINLGEWVHFSPFAAYDGTTVELKTFNPA
ncbi:MAG: UDP-2,3-diacylglucosamine diphosphatase [Bacteroidota bacterium]